MVDKLKLSVWDPIIHFAGHIFTGSVLFLIVASPAVGLSILVKLLGSYGIDGFTIRVLALLEHAILIGDAVLFLVYIGTTAYKSIKEFWT